MEPWEEVRIGVIGSVDSGKCFGENTLIKINNSVVKTIQDIRVGDLIIGADNYNLKKVARVTTGEGILFNVKQSNGNDYLVNEYHILCLKLQNFSDFNINYLSLVALYHYEDNTIDIDIREYFKLPLCIKDSLVGFDSNYNEFNVFIEEHSIGRFYGFSFDSNNEYNDYRFQLFDGTVVHNSTLTGVLSKKIMDDGRGLARKNVLRHPHEKNSGRTSCLVQHYMKGTRDPDSVKIFVDLAGHEKYLKTTIGGMSKSCLDYACIVVAANMGVLKMTREHLGITLGMNIPFFIVLTKTDLAPENVTKRTINDIMTLFKRFKANKKLGISKNPFILTEGTEKTLDFNHSVPVIPISNVTGEGVPFLRDFIDTLKPNIIFYGDSLHFLIECVYSIKGIGFVVSGLVKSGRIEVGNTYYMGPFFGKYARVLVKSIHNNFRENIQILHKGNNGCVNFKILDKDLNIKRSSIRKGIKFLDNPILVKQFRAKVRLLHHHTTIREGYQPVLHCDNISQSAVIEKMDREILRLHETAYITFKFRYHPEYIEVGSSLLFREGKTKGVGEVIEILD